MPGPQPTPTETLKLRGSWRAKARKADSPEPAEPADPPDCPEWLSPEAKAEWQRRVAESGGSVDRAVLTVYCAAYGDFEQLYAKVRKQGAKAKAGLVAAMNKAGDRVAKLAKQLGLNRPKTESNDAGNNDKSRFFKRG